METIHFEGFSGQRQEGRDVSEYNKVVVVLGPDHLRVNDFQITLTQHLDTPNFDGRTHAEAIEIIRSYHAPKEITLSGSVRVTFWGWLLLQSLIAGADEQ